jgi:outer membrane biogenesis lipoprotein LolB
MLKILLLVFTLLLAGCAPEAPAQPASVEEPESKFIRVHGTSSEWKFRTLEIWKVPGACVMIYRVADVGVSTLLLPQESCQ